MTGESKPIGQFSIRRVEGEKPPKQELQTARSVDAFFQVHSRAMSDEGFWATWTKWQETSLAKRGKEVSFGEKIVGFFPALYAFYTGKKEDTTFTLTPTSSASASAHSDRASVIKQEGGSCLISGICKGYNVRIVAYDLDDNIVDLDQSRLNSPIVLALLQRITAKCQDTAAVRDGSEDIGKMKVSLSYDRTIPDKKARAKVLVSGVTPPQDTDPILKDWERIRGLLRTDSVHMEVIRKKSK